MSWLPPYMKPEDVATNCRADQHWSCMMAAVVGGYYKNHTPDLTFLIPYGTDSQNRFENLCDVLCWITFTTTARVELYISENEKAMSSFKWFDLESATEQYALGNKEAVDREIKNLLYDNMCIHRLHKNEFSSLFNYDISKEEFMSRVNIHFEKREDGEPFHRTKYLNEMLNRVQTPYCANHDADVILSRDGLLSSLAMLRTSDTDIVYPYGYGKYQVMVHERLGPGSMNLEKLLLAGDGTAMVASLGTGTMIWDAKYGQSIIYRTESYKKVFGENEEFISWGPEDVERYVRSYRFKMKIARITTHIFHLEHPRGNESSASNSKFVHNEELWQRIQNLKAEELINYYQNLDYVKRYGWS